MCLRSAGMALPEALTSGYHTGLLVATGFAAVNILVALLSHEIKPDAERLIEAAAIA